MRSLLAVGIIFLTALAAFGQNEQAPMQEKEINYKDWAYKTVKTGEEVNLRKFAAGNKLTIVVYYAPWCPNWKFDAPMLERFYQKYKASGLGIIAVGLYDPVDSMKANLEAVKVTFPAVYESADRNAKQTSLHYQYRRYVGDARNWGSPWYVMLTPSVMEAKGDLLTKKTTIINGEMIEKEGDAFIRKNLGLPVVDARTK
jgi:thiol-disulfide isomerase/thioredoxin